LSIGLSEGLVRAEVQDLVLAQAGPASLLPEASLQARVPEAGMLEAVRSLRSRASLRQQIEGLLRQVVPQESVRRRVRRPGIGSDPRSRARSGSVGLRLQSRAAPVTDPGELADQHAHDSPNDWFLVHTIERQVLIGKGPGLANRQSGPYHSDPT
jgi:hypothetical protein